MGKPRKLIVLSGIREIIKIPKSIAQNQRGKFSNPYLSTEIQENRTKMTIFRLTESNLFHFKEEVLFMLSSFSKFIFATIRINKFN